MKRRLKIAMIVSMKYGLTQFMFRDIEALKQKGHNVTLFTLRQVKGLYNPLPSWRVVGVRWGKVLSSNLALAMRKPRLYSRLMREAMRTGSVANLVIAANFVDELKDSDVIYAYFGDHKLFVGYYCHQITGIPLVTTIRAYELYRNPNPPMLRHALQACARIVTVSEHNKALLIDRYGAAPDCIDVVRQILDLEDFQPAQKIKILIVGFFAEKKGHDVLFKALRRLERSDVELWVVGEAAPDRNLVDCRRMADELGVASQVAFFGQQRGNALKALYRECDIFCLPSRTDRFGDKEGFPNAIAEAMAFGKPVVSTRHAGIPEVVKELLVDENDPDQLAEALRRACNSAHWRQQQGIRNREIVETLFTPENNDRLEQILVGHAKETNATRSGRESFLKDHPRLRDRVEV